MKIKFLLSKLLVSLLIFVYTSMEAKIIESDTLDVILKKARVGDLVVFDIDNTISNPKSDLGSSEWFDKEVKRLLAQGKDFNDIAAKLEMIHEHVELEVISKSNEIIKKLQDRGIYVMALTSRSLPIANRTIEQMTGLGINFLINSLYVFDLDLYVHYPAKYSHGIVFGANNEKGEILINFLSIVEKLYPERVASINRVIFVDDRPKHVTSMANTFNNKAYNKNNLEFLGIKFNYKRATPFSLENAKRELCTLVNKLGFYPLGI